jgi:hypothetical protein
VPAERAAKPNLFIVGAPKCGTTAWVHYLSSHPDIFFSPVKEPHYFCTDFPNLQRQRTEAEYLGLFRDGGGCAVVGEASVRYIHSTEAAKNIKRFNPKAKIIAFVRDQADYLPSQHNQMLFTKQECIRDFETAWRLAGKRDSINSSPHCLEPAFLDYASLGAFSRHVERFYDQFPEDQIRVFHFRDWSRNPRATYLEILSFLGLPDDGRSEFPKINEAKERRTRWLWLLERYRPRIMRLDAKPTSYPRPNDALKREIASFYEADNARLERRIWRAGRE